MGMYTELHFNSKLKKNTPTKVIDVLKFMINWSMKSKRLKQLPKHNFFKTKDSRWKILLVMDSAYFDADTYSTLRYDKFYESYYLCIRSNIKNYHNEIENFINWIMPYLDKNEGEFLGFYRYEENQQPTLIFKKLNNEK